MQHVLRSKNTGTIILIQHPEEMAPGLLSDAMERIRTLPNILVLITTHAGSRLIHKSLKQEHSILELDLALRQEIETTLGLESHLITAIAPFLPLSHHHLAQILQQSLHNIKPAYEWKSINMTSDLATAWTNQNRVEYLEWQSKGKTILKFAAEGAKLLKGKIGLKLQSKLRSCFLSSIKPTMIVQLDLEGEDMAVFRWRDQNSEVYQEACRFNLDS